METDYLANCISRILITDVDPTHQYALSQDLAACIRLAAIQSLSEAHQALIRLTAAVEEGSYAGRMIQV